MTGFEPMASGIGSGRSANRATTTATKFLILTPIQCDQKKIAKCLKKLPKNDFTRKMIDFNTFTKIAEECGRFG